MNQATLADLFKLLPEADQEAAFIHSLELIFARSEWPLINELLPSVLCLEGHESLRARALSIGAKTALRLGQVDLAFARCEDLLEFGRSQRNILLQIETLYQLAIRILPASADKLTSMWEAFNPAGMPKEAADLWGRLGVLLWRAFSGNLEEGKADSVRD